ncbi:major facilitator superfamily transporter [Gluconacetobacter johannae DSM 13595]|uniref:MFS transporter n=1 Tax=Gluconacetobacter johannae TaxID=112140 RepID=A0A7W4J458_9PROT|nr:MFS transporter [Gluconacetobacter johannae]MBB2174385.1 MFS transporter [Gluconacetobacter johannae]GBQ85070.1 major facilitator superfamily transporter [Gluconacetobacter johannae DSM 13595]
MTATAADPRDAVSGQDPAARSAPFGAVAVGCSIGTFIEWFDYASYGYLAETIARVFFPSADGHAGLMAAYAVFALSFVLRPVGGVLWGHVGDRLGRRVALSLSIGTMSVATVLIALVPGYARIGMAAPIALLLLRMTQGFSSSGEYAGASTILMEHAPPGRRGFATALVPASEALGLLAGALMVAALSGGLTDAQMQDWGWRIPFLFGAPLGLIGWLFRARLDETLHSVAEAERQDAPILVLLRDYRPQLLLGLGISALDAIGFYFILNFMPVFISTAGVLSSHVATVVQTVLLAAFIPTVFAMGVLSDRIGRRPMLLVASLLFVVLTIPLLWLLGHSSFLGVVAIELAFGGMLAINDGTLPGFLTELFPGHARYSGFALVFNIANAALGGTAPFVMTWIMHVTGSQVVPGGWLVSVAAVALVCTLLSRRFAAVR